MKIEFRTKEESNRLQEEAFLALSPHERFMEFLKLSQRIKRFKIKNGLEDDEEDNNNFVIHIKR